MKTNIFKLALIPIAIGALITGCSQPSEQAQISDVQTQTVVSQANQSYTVAEINKSAYDVATRAANWQISKFGSRAFGSILKTIDSLKK